MPARVPERGARRPDRRAHDVSRARTRTLSLASPGRVGGRRRTGTRPWIQSPNVPSAYTATYLRTSAACAASLARRGEVIATPFDADFADRRREAIARGEVKSRRDGDSSAAPAASARARGDAATRAREGRRARGRSDARCGRGTRETKRSGCGLSFVDSKIVFIKMQSSKMVD